MPSRVYLSSRNRISQIFKKRLTIHRSNRFICPSARQVPMTILFDNLSTNSPPELNLFSEKERTECSKLFEKWPENDQTDFVQGLLTRMTHFQQSQINFYLSPMLQRDFISLLPRKWLI